MFDMAFILLYHALKATTPFVDAVVNERLPQLLPSTKTDVTPGTKSRDFDARQGVASQSRKCDRECRTLRHGARLVSRLAR